MKPCVCTLDLISTYGSLFTLSNLINKNPESPKFNAVMSCLFNTQMDAVALPGNLVRRKPNFRMFVGHKDDGWKSRIWEALSQGLSSWWLKLRNEDSESELFNEVKDSKDAIGNKNRRVVTFSGLPMALEFLSSDLVFNGCLQMSERDPLDEPLTLLHQVHGEQRRVDSVVVPTADAVTDPHTHFSHEVGVFAVVV